MKRIIFILFLAICSTSIVYGENTKRNEKIVNKNKTTKKKSKNFSEFKPAPVPQKILENQFAIYNPETDKYDFIISDRFEGSVFSDNCKNKKCEAYLAFQRKVVDLSEAPHPTMFNPAAILCKDLGGVNLIAINSKKAEENFCKFKDASYINSWDLYNKKFPVKVIK